MNQTKEPLIDSGHTELRVEIIRFRKRIVSNSPATAWIRNAKAGNFGLRAVGHEFI
ncbi:hypothetical protein BMS3Bbin11_01476 [bacterium BMS3Bbin11]|nr:hypothetical protein BMS3Abin11_02349 [bacterium BMS3Abin11]GBE46376.1 hypothetical protein BMS3Bbin11_01476 [bacterium BMS3Bbin11]GMT41409.1 MAG: hypothetical protein IEMM0001_2144 [bacterium]